MSPARSVHKRGRSLSSFLPAFFFPILVLLFLMWWLRRETPEQDRSLHFEVPLPDEEDIPHRIALVEEPAAMDEYAQTPVADDLAVVEGIGPRISALLTQAGVASFAQLAEAPLERLRQILVDAGVRGANPDTWPEQASLAAAGKWSELQDMQNRLRGGRRSQ